MVGKATSEGTKVTLGENAPVYREGAGDVHPESLAAQSVREGGEFAGNRNINEVGSKSGSDIPAQTHGSTSFSAEPQGQAAPSYVNNQYIRDSAGPHGKNITEDPELTGRPGKFNVEPGSQEDPARLAEKNLALKQTRGAPGTGERQDGAGNQQPYGALDNETSA
ncbi:hypothetical protein VP1G_02736 [Cytospora mali]|uniref:SMP domain-containing protein n=1 Tax=Cytospora mali TaxID=578113 RepID=A0A194UUV2_CYTMA|nr:hypothetical protein VP1G_02736 [Valsa mali var. pyri (nom. inval.)]